MNQCKKINILFIEDLPSDTELAVYHLKKQGIQFDYSRVDTEQAFLQALERSNPDIIVSDYFMPTFNGMQALNILSEKKIEIPFIILTGSINENTAVECIKAGANDYVIKEFIEKLPFSIQEALEHRQQKMEREKIENEKKESQRRFSTLVNNLNGMVYRCNNDVNWTMTYVSEGGELLTGYKSQDLINNNKISYADLIHPEDKDMVWSQIQIAIEKKEFFKLTYRIIDADKNQRWVYEQGCCIFSKNGKLEAVEGFITDISSLKKAEQVIIESEQILNKSQEIAHVGSWTLELDDMSLFWSDETYRIFGYDPQEFSLNFNNFKKCVHPDDLEIVLETYTRAVKTNTPYDIIHRIIRPNGEVRFIHEKSIEIKDIKGETVRSIGIVHDITEQQKAKERISHLNSILNSIRTIDQLVVREKNKDNFLKKASTTLVETRGFQYAWFFLFDDNMNFYKAIGADKNENAEELEKYFNKKPLPKCINKHILKEKIYRTDSGVECIDCVLKKRYNIKNSLVILLEHGDTVFGALVVSLFQKMIDDPEEVNLLHELASDIAFALYDFQLEENRKQFENQIKKNLTEKEILLKEIHHRVKNNLNVITSLLNLQANQVKNKKQAIEAFQDCRNRVFSIALVHEKLYKSKDFAQIAVQSYIETMTNELIYAASSGPNIKIELDIAQAFLDINKAIPFGLILNELVTNALKHAFNEQENGIIAIKFKADKDDYYQLIVTDNGSGFSHEIDLNSTNTLGLQLVDMLTSQLDGTLAFHNDGATQVTVRFPIKQDE